jgi:hypothetical protein
MRNVFLLLFCAVIVGCQNNQSTDNELTTDSISNSKEYKEYVQAYNEYQACKKERPALTTAYINKEITAAEFEKKLETNTKLCNLKQQVYNTRWRILQALYEKELTEEYQLKDE